MNYTLWGLVYPKKTAELGGGDGKYRKMLWEPKVGGVDLRLGDEHFS